MYNEIGVKHIEGSQINTFMAGGLKKIFEAKIIDGKMGDKCQFSELDEKERVLGDLELYKPSKQPPFDPSTTPFRAKTFGDEEEKIWTKEQGRRRLGARRVFIFSSSKLGFSYSMKKVGRPTWKKSKSLFSGLGPPPEVATARYAAISEGRDTRTRRDLIATGRLAATFPRFTPAPGSARRGRTPHRDTIRRESMSRPA
ncbi:hypothetical protein Taro_046831 [Colocasia esculenta]|uniref:Uncharacterized protein n=1 Tax=Colocasia esculenta TaxID=4460 RepID=A0A843X306_COLES|nr:hypothetical protein [Colocasia esculenta]